MSRKVLLAVIGTLMRSLKLIPMWRPPRRPSWGEAATEPAYHLWSIWDDHHGVRVAAGKGREPHRDRSTSNRTDAFAVCFRNGRSWLASRPKR
jgi:hypothetical protein